MEYDSKGHKIGWRWRWDGVGRWQWRGAIGLGGNLKG